ncbi:MAG: NADAR family protein [Clostridiales bacterium]|nr:NADAR family protein [Clostridiales bacterium]
MIRDKDDFYFFWGGPFSQWAKYDMTIGGIKYCSCEQYMMAAKATLFEDKESCEKIMEEEDPKKQKSLGRKVKNYSDEKWHGIAKEIVFRANTAKFNQHEFLKELLLNTGNKIIVEASPYDRIWGIGMGEDSAGVLDPDNWNGTNWLGEAIMRVRNVLRRKDNTV